MMSGLAKILNLVCFNCCTSVNNKKQVISNNGSEKADGYVSWRETAQRLRKWRRIHSRSDGRVLTQYVYLSFSLSSNMSTIPLPLTRNKVIITSLYVSSAAPHHFYKDRRKEVNQIRHIRLKKITLVVDATFPKSCNRQLYSQCKGSTMSWTCIPTAGGHGGTPFGPFPILFPTPRDEHMIEGIVSDYTLNSLLYWAYRWIPTLLAWYRTLIITLVYFAYCKWMHKSECSGFCFSRLHESF